MVGLGIAGISICEQLISHQHSFVAIDSGKEGATAKSGGVFNPTILKRFKAAWNSNIFYPVAKQFYEELSIKLGVHFFIEKPILRIFNDIEEQNNWYVASDKKELSPFLSTEHIINTNPAIKAELGYGKVEGTAKIDTDALLNEYKVYLNLLGNLRLEEFEMDKLQVSDNSITYKDITAEQIIFCTGAEVRKNKNFFQKHIIPNKGEYLIIEAPELKEEDFIKGPVYIIPLGNSIYKVGATFEPHPPTNEPTEKAKKEIVQKLEKIIDTEYRILDHIAGIRPTTQDHKPILGALPSQKNILFFTGLGSRGFTMAPHLSAILYEFITSGTPIPDEINLNRFSKSKKH